MTLPTRDRQASFFDVSFLAEKPFEWAGVRLEWHFHKPYAPLTKRALAIERGSFRKINVLGRLLTARGSTRQKGSVRGFQYAAPGSLVR